MNKILQKIPRMKDPELLQLFQNVIRLLSKGTNQDAEHVKRAIEAEWKSRLDRARRGTYTESRPTEGMLAALGYHVGYGQSVSTSVRRRILSHVIEEQLPRVGSPAYTEEWGGPRSQKRYWKLVRTLEYLIGNPSLRSKPNMDKAMIEWQEDLDWVKGTFGVKLATD